MTRALSLPVAIAERLRAGDERVLITGASGWLGQALLEMLAETLGPAFGGRVRCFGSMPKTLLLRQSVSVAQMALAEMASLPSHPSILFHFAYLTKEKMADMTPNEYVERNRVISAHVATAAAKVGADRVFLTSSGAATQAFEAGAGVDSIHAYGALKLEDEALFLRHAKSGAMRRVLTVRLFNLSGPYINKLDSYALSSFIEQARHTGVIEVKAAHRVIRSYTGVENLLSTAFGHLLDDHVPPWTRMDTAGESEVEIGELARRVCAIIDPKVVVHRPAVMAEGEDRYVGDPALYHAMAARYNIPLDSLDRQIRDTLDYLVQRRT